MKSHERMYEALLLSTAAGVIEQMLNILTAEGFEIEPAEIALNGVHVGSISMADLSKKLQAMAKEMKPNITESVTTRHQAEGAA